MSERDDTRMGGGEEDEEEEEMDEAGYKAVKDAVLFVIEVSKSMLEVRSSPDAKKPTTDSATSAALKCAYALMQQRIISHPNDMMGILLYGTHDTKFQDDESGSFQYPNCYLLADLDVPAASDVKRLRSMIEDEDEAKKLLVPAEKQVPMASVLFCANQIFTTKAANFASRRLFLVTDNDTPHEEKTLKSSAVVRAKDLYDLGVIIELFPISKPGHEFERSKFYDDIVYNQNMLDPEAPAPIVSANKPLEQGGLSLLQSLLNSINSKAVAKRALFSSVPLELSKNLKISVKGYIIFKRQVPARSCYIWLDGETPQIVEGKSAFVAEDTARTVEKVEIRKAFKFGGETITFTPDELVAIKNFGDPVIRLIGFKPLDMLPIWANLKNSTFIYPSEEDVIGSTRTFAALHQSMLKKKKFALVWYIPRKNATPWLAAVLPGAEKLGDGGEQVLPPGLWIIPLPYADDIRQKPEMNKLIRASDDLVDKMRQIMQQLQLPKAVYDPSRYPNPSLQWHYRILQAMALEENLPDKPEDKTVPKFRQIDKRAGPYIQEWGQILDEEYNAWEANRGPAEPVVKKRSAAAKPSLFGDGAAAKKVKTKAEDEGDSGPTDEEMKARCKSDTVGKLTIPLLKEWLVSKQIGPLTGLKKAELVEKVEEFFENKMQVE